VSDTIALVIVFALGWVSGQLGQIAKALNRIADTAATYRNSRSPAETEDRQ
jgi:hypothetical protein